MPEYLGVKGTMTLEENIAIASFSGELEVTNADASALTGTTTIINPALAAAQAQFRKIWTELYIDDGRGFAVLVPSDEWQNDAVINESLDGWSDQLTFTLSGTKWMPWKNALIRGKRYVEFFVSYGSPGTEYVSSKPIFTGYIQDATVTDMPPRVVVNCLDEASKYSDEKVELSIPLNSNRSRLNIFYDAINQGTPVPLGRIDLGGDGGIITKTVSTPPDARKFEVMRDFLSPTGTKLYFARGALQAVPFDYEAPVQKVLTKADFSSPMTVRTPATSVANLVEAVAVKFITENIDGTTTSKQIEIEYRHYNPRHWIFRQLSDGSIDGPNPVVDPAPSEIMYARTTTTETRRGNIVVFQQIDEEGWGSPMAARQELADDVVDHEHPIVQPRTGAVNWYQYVDGTWHRDAQETFRLLRRSITKKEFGILGERLVDGVLIPTDLRNFVVNQVDERYFYHFIQEATFKNVVLPPLKEYFNPDGGGAISLDEQGNGVYKGQESIGLLDDSGFFMLSGLAASSVLMHPDSSTTTTWDVDEDGSIKSQTIIDLNWSAGADVFETVEGAYRYGIQSKTYKQFEHEVFDGDTVTRKISYTQTSDDQYSVMDVSTDASGAVIRKSSTGVGARPRAEELLPKTSSQELRFEVSDDTRIDISGEVRYPIHNEYCENEAELEKVARTEIRDLSAWQITLPMPIEGTIHKDQWIAIDYPEIGLTTDKKIYVHGLERTFGTFRQVLQGRYYPSEVS